MATFEILAEEQRRRILDLLRQGERPVGELVGYLTLSQPAVSKHLRVLRQVGLVESRTEAQRRIYRLCPDMLREVDEWLAPYRMLWAESRDALETHPGVMDDDEFDVGGTPV
jgi:DNA-binding transcriptional ArsR family regulator